MVESARQSYLANYQENFKQKLQDIVAKLEIAPDLTITYRDFEASVVSVDIQEYLKQISPRDRNKYLAAKLQKYLYGIFSSNLAPDSNSKANSTLKSIPIANSAIASNKPSNKSKNASEEAKTSNYARKWSRTKFYQQLIQNNHGRGYCDSNWLVIKKEGDYWHVTKNELTLHIEPNKHLAEPSEEISPGKLVTLKMPPNLVDHGIYIAVGDSGSTNSSHSVDSDSDPTIAQLYFNVSPEGALILLDNLTQKLNAVRIPFDLKVAYDETEFDKSDKLDKVVLEFKRGDFDLIYSIANSIYQSNKTYFRLEFPFFCQFIAPGMGWAEKPRSSSFRQENIGQHFCGIIAQSLVKVFQQNKLVGKEKLDYVLNFLSEVGVDIEHLYLNPRP